LSTKFEFLRLSE